MASPIRPRGNYSSASQPTTHDTHLDHHRRARRPRSCAWHRALLGRPEAAEEPHVNPNTQTPQFLLRDLDFYYVTISAQSMPTAFPAPSTS